MEPFDSAQKASRSAQAGTHSPPAHKAASPPDSLKRCIVRPLHVLYDDRRRDGIADLGMPHFWDSVSAKNSMLIHKRRWPVPSADDEEVESSYP